MQRRKFIKNTISFSVLIAMHRAAQASGPLSKLGKKASVGKARFSEITLDTSMLEEQFEYYANVLEFPVISRDETQFAVQLGESILRFKAVKDGTEPFYHFAINIPSNKHKKAQKWLSSRTPLLMDEETGGGVLYFDFWDAHAMYFKDPAGNIGEFIARHTLDNDREGEFGIEDLLCLSEIGTPVESISDLGSALHENYGLDTYGESMFIGDEHGLFVAAPPGRMWFPENVQRAQIHPVELWLTDKGPEKYQYQDYPYIFNRKN
jgi:catechol 2,3-dioxygenase-like lactoylglutathione lyase family enzyme